MAYSHDVPVANPAPFINSATGEPMEWFAINDYDDYYYYDAYYYDFYGSDEPQGICTAYPGIKFDPEISSIEDYVNAEGCFLPNSHCEIKNSMSTVCMKTADNPGNRVFTGTQLGNGLECEDRKSPI